MRCQRSSCSVSSASWSNSDQSPACSGVTVRGVSGSHSSRSRASSMSSLSRSNAGSDNDRYELSMSFIRRSRLARARRSGVKGTCLPFTVTKMPRSNQSCLSDGMVVTLMCGRPVRRS